MRSSVAGYAGQSSIDLWVAPQGSDNLIRGSPAALVPAVYVDSIRSLPGVAEARPILEAFVPVRAWRGSDTTREGTLLAIGYETPDGLGGPPVLARGRAPRGAHEVALDRAAAFRLGVGVGDSLLVAGRHLVVSGLTSGTNILATQFLFADLVTSSFGTRAYGKASFILVRVRSDARVSDVAAAIASRFPDLVPHTRAAFQRANQREIDSGFLPLVALVGILGLAASAVLVVLLVHGAVEEDRENIAILFALGAQTGAVRRGVLRHGLLMIGTGALAGTLAALALRATFDAVLPTIPLLVLPGDVAAAVGAFILAGGAAALVPVARLRRVDPLDAFRP